MTKIHRIPLEQTRAFSNLLKDYLAQTDDIKLFQHYAPSIEGIIQAVADQKFSSEKRTLLKRVLKKQYATLEVADSLVEKQLERIDSNQTYFITTGQQIHVLGGPLYVLFKIATTIKLAEECNRRMPDKHFIPLFWMASEDHDLEEIDHLSVFGKTHRVDLNPNGPAGRVSTAAINDWIDSVPDLPAIFKQAYASHATLADATRHWIHDLFKENALLVIDADDAELKQSFIPVIEQELFAGLSAQTVRECTDRLEQKGYKGQIYPRDINLFYISEEGRHRIEFKNNRYELIGSSETFDQYTLKELVHSHPERFSPNVVLRPVYQQCILPNVAYVGGPAEVAYWLQLKTLFDKLEMRMPVLMPRNFGMVLNRNLVSRFQKLELNYDAIFLSEEELKHVFFKQKNYQLPAWGDTKVLVDKLWVDLENKAIQADGSLQGFIAAEKSKLEKQVDGIQKRVEKAYEHKLEQELKQLSQLQEKVLPGGSLQERKESFLSFMINDPSFVQTVIALLDPFDFSFHVFADED